MIPPGGKPLDLGAEMPQSLGRPDSAPSASHPGGVLPMTVPRLVVLLAFLAGLASLLPAQPPAPAFRLAPALALEAEDFQIESGWKVVANGQGNYMVDIIGFNHISGERLLCLDAAAAEKGRAYHDVTVPKAGKYRLWVRYEYPAFCEALFRVAVEQDGKE